ncbi:MAG: hypothetical protein LBL96_01890 [Clostridiales bacterium]|jgi:vacuolar-type H+-ATPase subunit H|nr:hypothetical protein [Clostridiales bacterium]
MENIITELIKIESDAASLITEAEADLARLDDLIYNKKQEITQEVDKKAVERLNDLICAANAEASEKIRALELQGKNGMEAMRAEFELNKEHWRAELFHSITSWSII